MNIILTGTAADIEVLKAERTAARLAEDTPTFNELTYMLGEIDRARGGKKFDEETIALEVAARLAQQFNNNAEDEKIQNQFDLICKLKSSANFYLRMLPTALTEDEIEAQFEIAAAAGAKHIGQFTKHFDKYFFGRFTRSVIVDKAQARQSN